VGQGLEQSLQTLQHCLPVMVVL